MKIVVFGDVHMATRNLARMDGVIRDADLVIVSGDLTNFGGVDDARKVLDEVRRYSPDLRAVSGNLDRIEVMGFLEDEGVSLHGRGEVIGGVGIFGCGGSNITPFHTPTELTEDEIYSALSRGYETIRKHHPVLMVCHTPPYNTRLDRVIGGKAVGSTAARRFIEEHRPAVCISGHIHESAGEDVIGPTRVFNPGPFKGGGYVVVETRGRRLDARLEFL